MGCSLSPALQPQHRCIAEKELWCPVVFLLFISLHSISWGLWWFGSLSFGYSADLFVFYFLFLSFIFTLFLFQISSAKCVIHGYLPWSLLVINLTYEKGIYYHLPWIRFAVYCYDFLIATMKRMANPHRFTQFFRDYFYHFLSWGWILDCMVFFTYTMFKKDAAVFFIKL